MQHKLIYIVPGFLTDSKAAGFSSLEAVTSGEYDVKIHNASGTLTQDTCIASLVEDLRSRILELAIRYTEIILVSHSAGAELVLRTSLPSEVKILVFWSPSMFHPTTMSTTLPPVLEDHDLLNFNGHHIGRVLAREIDLLDTRKLVQKIEKPYVVFLSAEDLGHDVWPSYEEIPYGHNYTHEELTNMLVKTFEVIARLHS